MQQDDSNINVSLKTKGLIQFRKVDDPDKRWYAPQRDITVVFPKIIRESFYTLETFFDDLNFVRSEIVEIIDDLDLTPEEFGDLAHTYGVLIRKIRNRENLSQFLADFRFQKPKAKAVLGFVFLDLMTREFAYRYYEVLHPGVPDPNDEELQKLQDQLYKEKMSIWRRIWKRICLAARFLTTRNYAGTY